MKTTVIAKSEQEAKEKVLSKIIFHKVIIKQKDGFNEAMNVLDEFQEIIGGKK